ncbi:ergothioneine biosynthesis protein EgtB [Streptomyces sp. OF3]|uniref:Hercynine oxygenase n=1 Tax=Streptomyces alkaliterrae TaxID=2213162 RepID=A0A7W3WR05_9ACTN|nr:ergothioneine biosynthesis protein EgtB [Streptomyces alkaliterrae]MBB1256943.1 ergothioneine biosynthesis protein EgtB [Streptomyces alkaliterrae]
MPAPSTTDPRSVDPRPVDPHAADPRASDPHAVDPRAAARVALERARARTRALVDCLDDDELTAQHSRLMSPLVWDLAHIGNQEEIWLVRAAGGRPALRPELDPLYDAFRTPRADRPALPLLGPDEARAFVAGVREASLEVLESVELTTANPLSADAFVFGMVAQHEQQHDETMLATHQLRRGPAVLTAPPPPAAPREALPAEVLLPGGPFTMGTDTEPWALDNERPAHRVDVPAFWLDTVPVTNAAYQEFVDAGGYDEPRWWHPRGWAYVREHGLSAPLFWRREGDSWLRRRFGHVEPVPPEQPVMHVCWYEADAYARWAGRRLPTEAEWEKAARHDPATGRSRRHPWGDDAPGPEHANLGQRHLEPAPAGAYPRGAAPCGARQLLGDVWEWTSSDFTGYPGFAAFPYDEYSKVFLGGDYGDYKVLRGGAFGVDPVACRATFRNWDHPIRRQIFAGFRTARDAEVTD